MGNQTRNGSRLSASGLRATRKRGGPSTRFSSLGRSIDSGRHCLAVVLADQAAQQHAPSDNTSSGDDGIASCRWWSQLEAAVWTFLVVVHAILPDDRLQVALVYHQHPVKTLPPTASDPALDVGVGSRRHERRQDRSSSCRSKDAVGSRRKLLVSVMDDGLRIDPFLF